VAGTVIFDGCAIAGAVVSLTVTVNEQDAVVFPASLAVQVTVVAPIGNEEPDAGTHTTVAEPEQLEALGVA